MTDRRSSDLEGTDFGPMRMPKRWKAWLASAGMLLGSAAGTYFAVKEKAPEPQDGKAVSAALQTLADLKISVDNLNATMAMINSERGATLEVARESRAEIGRLARRVSIEENAVDRHNEVMTVLDNFEKKGIKRR